MNIASSLLISAMMLLSACSKEKGDTGAAGATGAQGVQGNANVHSITLTNQSWIKSGSDYEINANVPLITQSIVNTGAVSVFISFDGGTNWTGTPITLTNGSQTVTITFIYGLSKISIGALGYTSAPNPVTLKVVAIEGAQFPKWIDKSDYTQVKSYYNL